MEKKYIFLILLLLTVGFASVNTIIDIKGKVNMSLLESDLDVIFKEVLLNKENNDKAFIIEEGKSFIYSADELTNIKNTSNIDYTIMNKSHQYDMEVKVTCTTDYDNYLSYTSETINKSILIEAGEVVTGNIITELIKENTSNESLVLKCTLNYIPVSRDTVVEEKEYIVSFDTGYEDKIEDIKVKYYESYGSLPELERKNYKFLGWYTSDDIKVENNSLVKTKDNHILHAKWEKICEYDIGKTWEFNYTGSEQTFTTPCDGEYKIELWGAQGGTYNTAAVGGYGAYSSGQIYLKRNNIYINVGGAGICGTGKTNNGGYNGGGKAISNTNYYTCSGAGASHISLNSGILSSLSNKLSDILIVSGSGGGAAYSRVGDYGNGGHGGGINGTNGKTNAGTSYYTTGGSQTSSGCYYTLSSKYNNSCNGGFGYGASLFNNQGSYHGGGGGSGLYGGGAVTYDFSPGGGGGSSYIGNPLLTNKVMYCYNCRTSNEESTKTISTTCTSATPTSNCAKQGNGYAKITYLGE